MGCWRGAHCHRPRPVHRPRHRTPQRATGLCRQDLPVRRPLPPASAGSTPPAIGLRGLCQSGARTSGSFVTVCRRAACTTSLRRRVRLARRSPPPTTS
ncbi:hypothetical protein ACP4OV_004571 [Aristida adscensionis]